MDLGDHSIRFFFPRTKTSTGISVEIASKIPHIPITLTTEIHVNIS